MPERNRKSETSSEHMFWWQSFRVRVKMNSRNIDSIKWFTCRSEKVLPLCLWRMEPRTGNGSASVCLGELQCRLRCQQFNFSGSSRKLGLFDCHRISRLIESKLFTLYFIAKHRVLPGSGRLYRLCGRTPFYIWIENHYEYANGNTGWDITCSNL